MDLAVGSPLRQGALPLVSGGVTAAVADYERIKREHLQTATTFRAQGLPFIPVVAGTSWLILYTLFSAALLLHTQHRQLCGLSLLNIVVI